MTRLCILLLLLAAPAALAVDVEGYVYTVDGTPVAKASVTAGNQRATTAEDGHFTVTAPADSIVRIEVRADGLPPANVLALAGDPPLTITLAPTPADRGLITTTATAPLPGRGGRTPAAAAPADRIISGTVRIGKKPLANAPLTIQQISERYVPPVTVTSDDKGRYRLAVAPGRYTVVPGEDLAPRLRSIHEDRMYEDGEPPFLADTTNAKEVAIDVELVAAPLLAGRVVGADDKPVARADVLVVLAGRSPLEFFHQPIVRTRPDGRFAVPLPAFPPTEPVEIVITPPRHSATRSKPLPTIVLPKFEPVTVRVVDREKKPLAGAAVTYAAADESIGFGHTDVLLMPHLIRRRATAGDDGTVQLHLVKGDHDLAAAAPKHQPRVVSQRVAKTEAVEIALEPGHAIQGLVHRGKQPVAGVQVMIRGGSVPRGERNTLTDEKGRFSFDALPRGTYTVGFFKHDEMIDKTLTVDAPAEVDVALPPAGILRGRVVDAETRTAVPEFVYTLEPLDDPEPSRMRGRPQRGASGGDGAFSTTVPVGRYRIVVAATGLSPSEPVEVEVTERDAAPIEIALGRGATITGRVTDEQGRPVAEAHVMIAANVGEIARSARPIGRMTASSAQTGEDGTFTLTGAETGPAQLLVRRAGYVLERVAVEVEPQTRVDVTLKRGLTITGLVTLGGKPVAKAEVGASTSAVGSDYQHTTTDERGRFTLEGLVPARYTISATRENSHAQLKDVDVAQRRELIIELDEPGRGVVFGTVTGLPRDARRAARGTVYVSAGERGAEASIDSEGNYRVTDAPAGTVDVVAHLESREGGRTSAARQIELAPGQSVRVDLDFSPALVVTGRVTYGASKPLPRAQIVFSGQVFGIANTTTRDDGTYEIGLTAPGRYMISINSEELLNRGFQTMREIRSSETIDIHLAEQTLEGAVFDAVTRQPLPGALVTLVPRGTERNVVVETIADTNGRFRMTTAAAGAHLLIASAQGYAHRTIDVQTGSGEPLRAQFELSPVSELRIRVIDARNGTPLDGHLFLADERGASFPFRPNRSPDGTEFLFSVAPGKYHVTAISPGYKEKKIEVTAPGTAVVALE